MRTVSATWPRFGGGRETGAIRTRPSMPRSIMASVTLLGTDVAILQGRVLE